MAQSTSNSVFPRIAAFAVCAFAAFAAFAVESLKSQWGYLAIGGTGYVTGIVAGRKAMYARTDVGGAYRYENGRWVQLMGFVGSDDVGLLAVDGLAVDPADDDRIYLLAGCEYFSNGKTVVFRSKDGGRTFESSDVTSLVRAHGNGASRQCGERIAVDPNAPNVVYCAGRTGGIIKSVDGGVTWSRISDLGVMDVWKPWPSWTSDYVNTTEDKAGIVSLLVDKTSGGSGVASTTVYAAASVTGRTSVFVSRNAGASFQPLSASLPVAYCPQRMRFDNMGNVVITYGGDGGIRRYNVKSGGVDDISLPDKSLPVGDVIFKKGDPLSMVACSSGAWRSQKWAGVPGYTWGDTFHRTTDGGATWTQVGIFDANPITDPNDTWIQGAAIHWAGCMETDPQNNDRMFVISGNGIFACDNVWADLPNFYAASVGVEESVASDLVSVPGGKVYSAIGDYDGFIHSSTDADDFAKPYKPGLGSMSAIAFSPYRVNLLVRVGLGENCAYTLDAGETWSSLGNSVRFEGGDVAATMLADGTDRIFRSPNRVAGEEASGAYYSDNYGAEWHRCDGVEERVSFEVDTVKSNVVYACSGGTFYRSADFGRTFAATPVPGGVMKIAHAAGASGRVYVGARDGLYVTDDYGATLSRLPGVTYVGAVGTGKGKLEGMPAAVYIWGMANGASVADLYYSIDGGATWARLNDDAHRFGGPGNGNFVVGDANTFGTVYMSTVGMGIVYHRFAPSNPENGNGGLVLHFR